MPAPGSHDLSLLNRKDAATFDGGRPMMFNPQHLGQGHLGQVSGPQRLCTGLVEPE